MNSQLMDQLASQRMNEIYALVANSQLIAAAHDPRESFRERAGWALIHAGLRLTGPPVQRAPRPHPAGL